ncbi:MAG: two-component system response regulator [Chloroflexi bacterium]|nr:MAG: two-component system response regulator [Chloroflexota bacterium]
MKPKVLYIEDNPNNMVLVQRILTAQGYEFLGAANGFDGLDMAKTLQPQLILLDVNLPDIDGYEVARRLRENAEGQYPHVPIIAVTANVLSGDAKKALNAGCDEYLAKPINISELRARVKRHLPLTD